MQKSNCTIIVIGIDIGKNSFHVVGHDRRGAIVLRHRRTTARRRIWEGSEKNRPACACGAG